MQTGSKQIPMPRHRLFPEQDCFARIGCNLGLLFRRNNCYSKETRAQFGAKHIGPITKEAGGQLVLGDLGGGALQ